MIINDQISIRQCLPEDMGYVRNIYCQYISAEELITFEETNPTVEEMINRRNSVVSRGFPYIVAINDSSNEIIGYSYADSYRSRSAYRYSVENSVYVSRNHCGKGIGKLLLGNLLMQLEKLGIKTCVAVLGTKEDNPQSFHLHSSFGFESVGVYKSIGFKNNKFIDRLHMQLDIQKWVANGRPSSNNALKN